MTSGNFQSIDISTIVLRPDRQRKDLGDVASLAASIRARGLIHPVLVDREHILVAGERRFTAIKSLGWTHIQVQYTDEVDPALLRALELEENIKRKDLTWQEQVDAVREYHELQCAAEPEWSQEKTGDALGIAQATVAEHIAVAKEIRAGNEMVAKAPMLSTAKGIVKRKAQRAAITQSDALKELLDEPIDAPKIHQADFSQWALSYAGPKFNFIHCDFPYGINADKHNQGAAKAHGGYSDSADTYWGLVNSLLGNQHRLVDEQAHLMFWHHPKYANETRQLFIEHEWEVNWYPLIWYKTNNAGIIPDPSHDPRQIYEMCLFATRGERKIVRSVSNAFGADTVRENHMSEKPEPMLSHFFRMVVDASTYMLDPTCGSGSSIRAAISAGAKHVQGLEINPEFVERANLALNQARRANGDKNKADS